LPKIEFMKELDFKQMCEKLQERFPTSKIECASVFSKDYPPEHSIWIPNGSDVPYTNKDQNPLSSLDRGMWESDLYDFEVYIKLNNWLGKRGWYASTGEYTLMLHII
jgi:hypothetical protein